MKTYLLIRVKEQIGFYLAIGCSLVLLHFIVNFELTPGAWIGFYATLSILTMFIGKSSWYLLLPVSRKKLFGFHFLEISIVGALSFSIFALFMLLTCYQRDLNDCCANVLIMAAEGLLIAYTKTMLVVINLGAQQFQMQQISSIKPFLRLFKEPKCLLGFALVLCVWWLKDAWLMGLIGFGLFLFFPLVGLRTLVMPASTFKSVLKIFAVVYSILAVALLCAMYLIIFFAPANWRTVNFALRAAGHLPIWVDESRAQALFESTDVTASRALLRILKSDKFHPSDETWERKVAACKTNDCLALANQMTPAASSDEINFKHFAVIIGKCKLQLRDDNRVICTGPELSRTEFAVWYKKLAQSPVATDWLKSNKVDLQVFAMAALTHETQSPEQTEIIKGIEKSENPILKTIALDNLNSARPKLKKPSD